MQTLHCVPYKSDLMSDHEKFLLHFYIVYVNIYNQLYYIYCVLVCTTKGILVTSHECRDVKFSQQKISNSQYSLYTEPLITVWFYSEERKAETNMLDNSL